MQVAQSSVRHPHPTIVSPPSPVLFVPVCSKIEDLPRSPHAPLRCSWRCSGRIAHRAPLTLGASVNSPSELERRRSQQRIFKYISNFPTAVVTFLPPRRLCRVCRKLGTPGRDHPGRPRRRPPADGLRRRLVSLFLSIQAAGPKRRVPPFLISEHPTC